MGLLPKFIALLPTLSIFCAVVGVSWLALFIPTDGQFRRTYISENALMPSQAYSYFRETEWNVLRGYRTQIELFKKSSTHERNEEVSSWLQQFGAKTAIYANEEYGETLYGILHAPRGDGTEAMVLAAPWFNSENQYNTGGIALAVSLSRFFSRWPVWSKNIIIVLSEDPQAALRSWVEAYHTSLDLTGGSIEAAVVMDFPGSNDFFKYVEIHFDGLNGELPNLDLVNVAVHITEHEGMKVSLHGIPEEELGKNDFFSRMKTIILGVKNMALSGVKKSHGNEVFSGWRIHSVTLKACGTDGPFDITTFGRIPEAIFRSVNNLLEKFHQSFFFYLLLAPRLFVSIGSYLPAAVALSVSFALASLNTILNNEYTSLPLLSTYNVFALLGFAVALFVSFITAQAFLYAPQPELLLGLNVLLSLMPIIFTRVKIRAPFSYRLKSFAYLYFSVVLTSLLVVNFSLAFGLGCLAFPMTLVKTTSGNLRAKLKNCVLLLISNPFIAIWLFAICVDKELQGVQVFYGLTSAWKDLGCWTWFVICIGWLPSWLLVAYSGIDSVSIVVPQDEKTESKNIKNE